MSFADSIWVYSNVQWQRCCCRWRHKIYVSSNHPYKTMVKSVRRRYQLPYIFHFEHFHHEWQFHRVDRDWCVRDNGTSMAKPMRNLYRECQCEMSHNKFIFYLNEWWIFLFCAFSFIFVQHRFGFAVDTRNLSFNRLRFSGTVGEKIVIMTITNERNAWKKKLLWINGNMRWHSMCVKSIRQVLSRDQTQTLEYRKWNLKMIIFAPQWYRMHDMIHPLNLIQLK